jgi:hypothetical protein
MSKEGKVHDIEITGDAGDAGSFSAKWKCPDCGCELHYAPALWWDLKCDCDDKKWNYVWHAEFGKRENV